MTVNSTRGIGFDDRNNNSVLQQQQEYDRWSRTSSTTQTSDATTVILGVEPSAPPESDLWMSPDGTEPNVGSRSPSLHPPVPPVSVLAAQLESIPSSTSSPVFYDYQTDGIVYTATPADTASSTVTTSTASRTSSWVDRRSTTDHHSPEELEQRFHYIDSLANGASGTPIRRSTTSPEHVMTIRRIPSEGTRTYYRSDILDATFPVVDEEEEERNESAGPTFGSSSPPSSSSSSSSVLASGVAGAVLGTLVLGTIPGVIAGFYAAYVHNDDGAAGDISRALGEVAIVIRQKAVMIEARHHVVDKTMVVLQQAFGLAMELNRRHRIAHKMQRFAEFAWALTLDYIRQKGREIQHCPTTTTTTTTVNRNRQPAATMVVILPPDNCTTRQGGGRMHCR